MDKKIILIGGAPFTGKSFLAQKLLEKLNLPWVSTDSMRMMMKELAPKEKYPELWELHGDVEEYLKAHAPREVFENHRKQDLVVWEGVKAWISKTRTWNSYVIEGVAIIPEMINRDFGEDARIKPIFLYDNNRESILAAIHARGLWDSAPQYSESVNKMYIEWVLLFNEWLKGECTKYGYPLVEVGDRATLLDRCLPYIQ